MDRLPASLVRSVDRTSRSSLGRLLRIASLLPVCLAFASSRPDAAHGSPSDGTHAMLEPHTASLLVDYFQTFLRDQDIEAFSRNVSARYSEGTLARLARSGNTQDRRAAMLALGLLGSSEVNAIVGRGLRDADPSVRNLAQSALLAIGFRADTPENNATLQQIRDLNNREQYRDARDLANRLIERAPRFAEAYNQRAIAAFSEDRFAESILDCRRVLKLNPYHIGALSGMGQCYLRLNRRNDALTTFRRALELQPYSDGLKQTVAGLEADPGE